MDHPNTTPGTPDSVDGRLLSEGDSDRFEHVLDHIRDAVVEFELVDDEPIVRGVNPSFVSVFGYEPAEIRGESLIEYLVPAWQDGVVERLECRPDAESVNYQLVRRQTAEGLGEFLFRTTLYETDDRVRGFAVYTDLTDSRRKTRQLEVINRVFRHNLRNELNVVVGAIDRLEDRLEDEEARRLLSSIREGTANLEQMTAESTAIHHVRNEHVSADVSVDGACLLRSVAERFRDRYPNARIDLSIPETLSVVAATDRLESAIAAVVENAIEHNPADRPRVWIDARRVPDTEWAEIAVADDGPEIPKMERQVVTGEAEISQTYHGSGLGLWLARWTVEKFGGDLSFSRSDAGGNRVQLRLRRP